MVLMESEKCLRKTSDEEPRRRGGGKNNAPLALLRRRLLFPVLALMIICASVQAQPSPDSVKADTVQIETGEKDPWAACLASCLMPGAGQVYNGQTGKGCVFFGGYVTGWVLMYKGMQSSEGGARAMSGLVLLGAAWVGSVIDAPASARDINRKRGFSTRSAPGVGLVFAPDPRNPRRLRSGVGLRAGF